MKYKVRLCRLNSSSEMYFSLDFYSIFILSLQLHLYHDMIFIANVYYLMLEQFFDMKT